MVDDKRIRLGIVSSQLCRYLERDLQVGRGDVSESIISIVHMAKTKRVWNARWNSKKLSYVLQLISVLVR